MKKVESKITTYFTVIFIILFLLSIVFLWMIELRMKYSFVSQHKLKASNQIDVQAQIMESHFHAILSDLFFLAQLNEMVGQSNINGMDNFQLIEKEFLIFITNKKVYDQVRLLDTDGMEVVRVNNNGGFPKIVSKKNLQNKKNRPYFQEAVKKSKGELYISPFDLNIEEGELQTPLMPVIRFGVTMWGGEKGDVKKGVLLLNYLGELLISDFRKATKIHPGVFSLLNDKGYWLYNNNRSDEWGFMFEDKKDHDLAHQNPKLWELMQAHDSYQVFIDNYLYTFRTISVFSESYSFPWRLTILNTIAFDGKDLHFQKIPFETYLFVCIAMALLSFFIAKLMMRRKVDQDTIKHMALYDSLTGLANKHLFREKATQTIYQSRRYDFLHAVFFIDLDGFRSINDTLGYKIGDDLLKKIAALLSKSLREADIVARFGEDEFVLLLSKLRNKDDAAIVAEKILFELSKGFVISGNNIQIGASIGIVLSSTDNKSNIDDYIQLSDLTMYEVKKSGKNSFKIVAIE